MTNPWKASRNLTGYGLRTHFPNSNVGGPDHGNGGWWCRCMKEVPTPMRNGRPGPRTLVVGKTLTRRGVVARNWLANRKEKAPR